MRVTDILDIVAHRLATAVGFAVVSHGTPMSALGGKPTLAPLPNGCQWPQANHLLLSKEPNNPAAHFIPLISHG